MKELHGLKVKAIAVEVPEESTGFRLTRSFINKEYQIILLYDYPPEFDEPTTYIVLPEATWTILGRVSDVFAQQKIIEQLFKTTDHLFGWAQWQKYCAKHGLTNELILISNE